VIYKRVRTLDERIAQHFVQIEQTAATTRPFVAVLSSEDFVRGGYSRDSTGARRYLAPYADVLLEAHKIRVERGDRNIGEVHLADAIETLVTRSRESLSDDRSPKDPY